MKSIVTLALSAAALTLSACSGDVASPAAAPQGARKSAEYPARQFFVHASAAPVLRLGNRVNVYGMGNGPATYLGVVSSYGYGKWFAESPYASLQLRALPTPDCTFLEWTVDGTAVSSDPTFDTIALTTDANSDIEAHFNCR